MPVAILDMIVIGVLLVSGLLAMLRGFTREVLAIASWVVAAICAYLFYKQLVPFFMENVIKNEKIAVPAAAASIFLGALIVAYFVTAKLSDMILDSRIGALDRTLGFLFGVARGFLLMVVAFGLFEKLVGEKQQPVWVAEAKTRPMLKSSSDKLMALLPEDLEQQVMTKLKKNTGEEPKEPPTTPQAPAR
ncbi:MAG: CvpA family protein [Proteobacteria bacterium]|nr:CvpA family protein [Pseudomonadota bacterium]